MHAGLRRQHRSTSSPRLGEPYMCVPLCSRHNNHCEAYMCMHSIPTTASVTCPPSRFSLPKLVVPWSHMATTIVLLSLPGPYLDRSSEATMTPRGPPSNPARLLVPTASSPIRCGEQAHATTLDYSTVLGVTALACIRCEYSSLSIHSLAERCLLWDAVSRPGT